MCPMTVEQDTLDGCGVTFYTPTNMVRNGGRESRKVATKKRLRLRSQGVLPELAHAIGIGAEMLT
jgi:hypothetical protein